jgi:CRISPR-associated protein Csb1
LTAGSGTAARLFFPATYAAAEDKSKFAGGYNIDVFPTDEKAIGAAAAAMIREGRLKPTIDLFPNSPNICLVDSVGSQANRIEPLFREPKYRGLVPQIIIKAGEKSINLLFAGHRAGDAVIRFSKAGETVWNAFQSLLNTGNAEPLAKIAPTSLLFGVWDSRGTQVKVARAFRAVIRAYDVHKLSRSAQFNRATKFVEEGTISEALDVGDGDKNPLSREGFKDSPATATHGGVIAKGEIRREITINLSAIRRLRANDPTESMDDDAECHLKLRRYILGLAVVAATATFDELFDLREGCHLRQKPGTQAAWKAVPYRGEETPLPDLTDAVAFQFATTAAQSFGVGESDEFSFDKATAEKWLALKKEEQEKRRRNGPMTKQFEGGAEPTIVDVPPTSPPAPRRGRRSKPEGGSA